MKKIENYTRVLAASIVLPLGSLTVHGVDVNKNVMVSSTDNTIKADGSTDALKSKIEVCSKDVSPAWVSATQTDFNLGKIASALGVTYQQVERGKFGEANCKPGIMASNIMSGQLNIIGVASVSKECLVIGVDTGKSSKPPVSSEIYNNVLALCVAPGATSVKA
jgi:hypothetical protein